MNKKIIKRLKYRGIIMIVMTAIVWMTLTAIWAFTWEKSYADNIIRPFGWKGNLLVYAVYAIVIFVFSQIYGAYRIGYYKQSDVIFSGCLAMLITNMITYLQTCLVGRAIMDFWPFVVMTAVDAVVILAWAVVSNRIYYRLYPPHRMLVVYGNRKPTESLLSKLMSRREKYEICETLSVEEGLEQVFERIGRYESVIICDVKSEQRNKILKYCYANNVRVYITPKISDILIRGSKEVNLFDTPLLLCRSQGLTLEQRFAKRAMDIVISGLMIVVLSPVMLIVAAVIKLYDGGPALFKQERCTRDGKVFKICKFRSMIVDAEKDGKLRPCVDGDPRITPIGRFIRKTRLDELPQLFNIFAGEMSVVGPRPERIEHVKLYSDEIPEFAFRMKVKGGLTGLAQIVGRYNTTAYDKLKLDLMYIENYSIWMDIKLILMTVKIMFMNDSTAGFDERTVKKMRNEVIENK